jgi:translation initiation factor IF-3
MAHIDLGRQIFLRVKAELQDVCKVERDSKMEGRRMTMVLQPENKSARKQPEKQERTGSAPAGERLNVSLPSPAAAPAAVPPPAEQQPATPPAAENA